VAGANGHGDLLHAAPAQELDQKDHLVVLICGVPVGPRLLEFRDPFGQLRPRAAALAVRRDNRRTQKLGEKLKLVAGKARQEAASFRLQGPFSTRN
jgi:hypothetical protein